MHENVNNSVMVLVGVSRMKKTSVVIFQPGAKVNNEYYCEHFLRRSFLPAIQATCGRYNWTLRQVGTLSHTARNTVNFLLQENATFIELDKWQPNSSDLKLVDYAIVIVIVSLYSASSGEAPQRHSRPDKTKP